MKEIDEDVKGNIGFIDDGTQFEQELEKKEEAERWFEQHKAKNHTRRVVENKAV